MIGMLHLLITVMGYHLLEICKLIRTKWKFVSKFEPNVYKHKLKQLWNTMIIIATAFCNNYYLQFKKFYVNRDKAVMVDGHPIYFRGFRILNAVIEYLLEEKGMKHADNVIMTGCSGEL